MPNNPAELDKPAGAQPAAGEPVIHVIPDKFFGAALKKKVAKEPPKPPTPPPATPPPQLAPPLGPDGKPLPPQVFKKKKSGGLIVVFIILVLLLGGAGAAYFLLLKKPAASGNANVSQNVNTEPPAPVCGDAKCESPKETPQSCSTDCGPPPPVCGDAKCESPKETPQSCSTDCGPPPPVCGDAKCEADETVEACPADCTPPEPVAGVDSDSDGLSDAEESGIYLTSSDDPNTDKDSFVDLNEVLNLFDPATPAPSLLADNPGIAEYQNELQGYALLRPASWTVKGDETQKEVFFNAPSGEFILILAQEKPADQSLMDWYLAQAPGVRSSDVEVFKTRQGYDEILSPDRMTAFVGVGAKVFVMTYNLGTQNVLNFKVTHQMMVNSLIVK